MSQTGDYDDSLAEEQTGKRSLFGKLKDKTKDTTHKLKSKIKGGSDESGASPDEAGSEEEEAGTPVTGFQNEQSPEEQFPHEAPGEDKNNFPGNFRSVQEPQGFEDDSGLSEDFQGLSTNDAATKSEDAPAAPAAPSAPAADKSYTDQATETASNTKTKVVETVAGVTGIGLAGGVAAEEAEKHSGAEHSGTDTSPEAGKSWSQWAAEKVGYGKDQANANIPTTAEGKPIHQHIYDTANEQAVQPGIQQATGAKDAIAEKTSAPANPSQQSYVGKATSGFHSAKDSLFSSTKPQEHDKALSAVVTESVGNLPAALKSYVGLGAKSPAADSPTTTPTQDASLSSPGEGGTPQSPGLVSRFTSLFGAASPKNEATTESVPGKVETS